MDVPWLRHVPYLEATDVIYPEELDGWEKKTGRAHSKRRHRSYPHGTLGPQSAKRSLGHRYSLGGALRVLRTVVQTTRYRDSGRRYIQRCAAFKNRRCYFPDTRAPAVAMGTPMFDQCDLEPLAKAATARKRWTFLLTAAPLRATGGTGSPYESNRNVLGRRKGCFSVIANDFPD